MSTQTMPDLKVPATVRISESLWKRAKKLAIDRGCTASELTEVALTAHLEAALDEEQKKGGGRR